MNRIVLTLTLILSSLAVMAQDVAPIITAHWGQNLPYNLLCPKDTGSLNFQIAGCGPIAMAQLMRYLKYPSTSPTEDRPYRFDLMPDQLNPKSTRAQIKAVAELISDCGHEASTRYGADISLTNNNEIINTMIHQFHYSPFIHCLTEFYYPGKIGMEMMKEMVFNEIREGRVVIASGQKKDIRDGHIFLIDGIKGDKVHVNFGWLGKSDGYYPIDSIQNFTHNLNFIIGIGDSTYKPKPQIIKVDKPGTLEEKLIKIAPKNLRYLKIEGYINEQDLKDFRQFTIRLAKASRNNVIFLDIENTDLTNIPEYAFQGNPFLNYIKLPKQLKTIGYSAFFKCIHLKNIDIPNTVSTIKMHAFANCI